MIAIKMVNDYCKALEDIANFGLYRSISICLESEHISAREFYEEHKSYTPMQRAEDITNSIWDNSKDAETLSDQCKRLFNETKQFHFWLNDIWKMENGWNHDIENIFPEDDIFSGGWAICWFYISLTKMMKFIADNCKDKEIKDRAFKLARFNVGKPQKADIVKFKIGCQLLQDPKALADHLADKELIKEESKNTLIQAFTDGVNIVDIEPIKWLESPKLLACFSSVFCTRNNWKGITRLFIQDNGDKFNEGSLKVAASKRLNGESRSDDPNIIDDIEALMKKPKT